MTGLLNLTSTANVDDGFEASLPPRFRPTSPRRSKPVERGEDALPPVILVALGAAGAHLAYRSYRFLKDEAARAAAMAAAAEREPETLVYDGTDGVWRPKGDLSSSG